MAVSLTDWLRHLHSRLQTPTDSVPDAELLRRFTAVRDEEAFATLVARHGPMVFGVCRRVCGPTPDAEDAFQAAFVVLAVRAAVVGRSGKVGAWLHGVAFHVARKARDRSQRWTSGASEVLDSLPVRERLVDPDAADTRERIDEILAGLPEKYRACVVLCDLEGVGRKEAAARLGWTEGTLSGRLARARRLLAERLARRGVTLGCGAAVLSALAPPAVVAGGLATSTVRAATLVAAGASAGEAIPASAAALAQGVPAMQTATFRPLATASAVVAVALSGIGLYALTAAPPVPPVSPPDPVPLLAQGPAAAGRGAWVEKRTFAHKAAVNAVAFDRGRVAAGDEAGCLLLWDAKAGGKELLIDTSTLAGAEGKPVPISFAQFSPDGKAIYLALADGTTIQQCSLDKVGKRRVFPGDIQQGAVSPRGLTPEGKYWLESVALFDPDRTELSVVPNLLPKFDEQLVGEPVATFRHAGRVAHAAAVSGEAVVSVSLAGILWRWEKGKDEPAWEVKLNGVANIDVTGVLISSGGRRVAVTGDAGQVWTFDAESGKLLARAGELTGPVRAAAFSPDGRRIVAGCEDGTARVHDAETGRELAVLKGHAESVTAVAFGPDGAVIVTGSTDKTVKVWEFRK